MTAQTARRWEEMWAPYDEATYQAVLTYLRPDDVVLDIGAGDLRLALRMAPKVQLVYALEQNEALLANLTRLPPNVQVLCTDARTAQFPPNVTAGVLLMRHCRHYQLYAQKLAAVGCERLITNARWGMHVEFVNLRRFRVPYTAVFMGWYACACGAIGFKPGPAENMLPEMETVIHEVRACPTCQKG